MLDLSNNQLSELPEEIEALANLSSLDLSKNQLATLPLTIGSLARLTSLDLSSNEFVELPPQIGQLTTLNALNLSSNQLTKLPPQIKRLVALKSLDVSNNKLTSLPPVASRLESLTSLSLDGNRISSLPKLIGDLKGLKLLSLDSNKLGLLPSEIGRLRALGTLSLNDNKLSSLPPEIGQLAELTHLALNRNRLNLLPSEIGKLTGLQTLLLERNALKQLPRVLLKLSRLRELALNGNGALRLPPELLGPGRTVGSESGASSPRAILDFYFSREFEGAEAMREVRLLLVGRGRVGKTSLLKALRSEQPDKHEPETPGITVRRLDIACPQGGAIGHVWDFGGQEFLHGTHQIFLAERCVYLLVLEGRSSNWEAETDYWLRFIQSFGGSSPVIVVLGKYVEHPFSVDRFRLQERCPQIVGFVEIDSFDGLGIPKLQELLAQTVDGMKDVWLGVPKSWHAVKQQLTDMPQSFLEYRDYQALCDELGVSDEEKQDSLAQTLHRLGIALNFRDHHRLRQTSVLKPEWVTEAIYGLLRYVQKRDCAGVLERAWVKEALDQATYPVDKHRFVIELMERFEVAFQLEGTQKWLIPELLREEQPEAFAEFRGPNIHRLRFSYPEALPPGLLPRLIVRTHEMSEAQPQWRWRSGVVLEWGVCRALVRLDRNERRTEIAVIGESAADREAIFDLIRDHLTLLHGNVRVEEEVELHGHAGSWVQAEKLRQLERNRTPETQELTKDSHLANVQVSEALDAVESREARAAANVGSAPPRMRLFVSYAHEDIVKVKRLSPHLTILGRRGYIQPWQDTQLVAGEQWRERIVEELRAADIVLMLYSTNSCASSFIQEVEAPLAVERALSSENPCTLIVVPLDRNEWDLTVALEERLRIFQTATWNAKPVLEFKPQRGGWHEVERSIRDAVELRRRQSGSTVAAMPAR